MVIKPATIIIQTDIELIVDKIETIIWKRLWFKWMQTILIIGLLSYI